MSRVFRLVWDLPTRLFHWSVVALVFMSWLTQHEGRMGLHFLSGYALLTLLIFRLIWGFVGSDTARFVHFLRPPREALTHLRLLARREADDGAGHNPAGGWMVLVLLGLLGFQVATGLCSNDQALAYGPFADALGQHLSDRISVWHNLGFTLIEIAVAVHVTAVIIHKLIGRHDLVGPMITGRKEPPPRMRPTWHAAATLALAAAGVIFALRWVSATWP